VAVVCTCSYAGLPCKEVTGHAKSVGYEPGMKITEDKFANTWNVVLIMGDWWPVHCNWGARYTLFFFTLHSQADLLYTSSFTLSN